jgi:hypothetical protein
MPKRREDGGGDIGLLLFVLVIVGLVLLTATVYAAPIALALGILVYERRAPKASQSFKLEPKEIEALTKVERELWIVRTRLSEISEEGSHLKQNLDGSYHRGSRLGVQLNAEIEELLPRESRLASRGSELRARPLNTLDAWKRTIGMRDAFRWTAVAYLVVGLGLYLLDPDWMNSWSRLVEEYILLRLPNAGYAVYGSGLVASLVGIVFFPIAYFVGLNKLDRLTAVQRQSLLNLPDFEDAEFADEQEDVADDTDEHDAERYKGEKKQPWYEVLGVSSTAGPHEIDAAWREQVKKCHPDLVSNLDPDFRALAEAKAKALNAAREEGLKYYRTRSQV